MKGTTKRIVQWAGFGISILFCMDVSAHLSGDAGARDTGRDIERVKLGLFAYRDLDHGAVVGTSTITIRKMGDHDRFLFASDAHFKSDFNEFTSQRWEAITTSNFIPIKVKLAFVRGAEVSPVFDIEYMAGRVAGFVVTDRACASHCKRPVSASVPEAIVDQRIDWAAVLASDLGKKQTFEFEVFDPIAGISRAVCRVGSPERVRVPAGDFDAIRVVYEFKRPKGNERFQVLVSAAQPRMMLREEFPNGVISELLSESQAPAQP